jgi:transcriptional regulator with XRE-family HTH domain
MPNKKPRSVVEIHGYATRAIRVARGRKVADLAETLGVDRSYIAHIENGTKRRVSPEFYSALLIELGVEDHRALLATAPERPYIETPEVMSA